MAGKTETYKTIISKSARRLRDLTEIVISMAGFVPRSATFIRILLITASLVLSLYFNFYQPYNSECATLYFILSETGYIGFIFLVLGKNGLRHWFIRRWRDEKKGYRAYETLLGFLFFHNGSSIAFLASSSPETFFPTNERGVLLIIIPVIFSLGVLIKIWAAKVVTIDIYYWKDMFLGRKICDFVVTGPYKYFSNPMYGIGQLPAYASAIWYGSKAGLIAAILNQALIFLFYFLVEKKFINRIYLADK